MTPASKFVRSGRVPRIAQRAALLAWAGFWTWFVLAVSFGEPPPPPWWIPAAWIASLSALVFVGWRWPGIGGAALIAAGAASAAYFDHPGARALLSAPAFALGIAGLALSWRAHRAAPIAVLALLFVPSGCAAPQDPADLPFRTRSILRHENGSMQRAQLLAPADIRGLRCQNWVWWHDNGRLDSVELARDERVQGHDLPACTRVFFDAEGFLAHAWLSRDAVIDGWPCRGRWKIDTAFHPNGRVKAFFPPRAMRIDGLACAATVFHPVYLNPDGSLRECKLADDAVIDGRRLRRGDVVQLPIEVAAR